MREHLQHRRQQQRRHRDRMLLPFWSNLAIVVVGTLFALVPSRARGFVPSVAVCHHETARVPSRRTTVATETETRSLGVGHQATPTSFGRSNSNGDDPDPDRRGIAPPDCVLKERNPYDVHVYYDGAEEREAAVELRQKLHEAFGDWMRFYPLRDRPIGPHPLPMWEADFGAYEHRDRFRAVAEFLRHENGKQQLQQNKTKKRLSILIHPHSVDGDYADHTRHAFWDGEVLDLRIGGWKR